MRLIDADEFQKQIAGMGAVHSGNDRVAEKVMKHCIKTRKDIVIQQQAKPSKMQAASHIM